jgi:hypothetical protein
MKTIHPPLMRLSFLIVAILVLSSMSVYSQEAGSCAEKLKNAQTLFQEGHVEMVPSMISECMKSGFNREESLAAYKVLIQSYLLEEKLEMADSTMLAFLKINPEYQISPTDHSSFVNLFNEFKVKPVVQITLHVGTNLPYLTFIDPKSTSGDPGKKVYSTKALFNLLASVEAKFELTKKLDLNFEAGYSQLAFTNVEDYLGFAKINYAETQKRIEIPVSITYNFKSFGKFTPFARLGAGAAVLLSSSAKATLDPTDLNNPNKQVGPDLDRKASRIFMDIFGQVGGGLKFKTRGGYFTGEIRSNAGLFNQTIRGGDPATEADLSDKYKYVDDDFHLNSLNFSIGYTRIFYKPSKRKE